MRLCVCDVLFVLHEERVEGVMEGVEEKCQLD